MLIEARTGLERLATNRVAQEDSAHADALKNILRKEGIVTRHKRGDVLVQSGTRSDRVYLIEHGFVAETCFCASGKRQVLDFEMDGGILMPSCPESSGATQTIEVLADTVSHMMSVTSFQRFAMENVDTMCAVSGMLRAKLARAYDHMSNMGCRQGRERIRHLLLSLYDRLSSAGCNPSNLIPLRQVDLADAAGVTTVYVNQILKKFEAEGAIGLQKGAVIIRDAELMRKGELAAAA